jgi:hypothetical protein
MGGKKQVKHVRKDGKKEFYTPNLYPCSVPNKNGNQAISRLENRETLALIEILCKIGREERENFSLPLYFYPFLSPRQFYRKEENMRGNGEKGREQVESREIGREI